MVLTWRSKAPSLHWSGKGGKGYIEDVLDLFWGLEDTEPVQVPELNPCASPVHQRDPQGSAGVLKVKEVFLQSVSFLADPKIVQHNGVIS